MKQISRMKSRMGFHPRLWCCIVILVKERYEVNSLPYAIGWLAIRPARAPAPGAGYRAAGWSRG